MTQSSVLKTNVFKSVALCIFVFVLADLIGAILPGFAGENENLPLSSYTVTRTTGAISIDGKLDEADWSRAVAAPLKNPVNGSDCPYATTIKLLWDDTNLYAGFYCEDADAWATYTARDGHLWEEEVVELFIDPDGYGHFYYEYEYNPLNNVVDLVVMNAGERKNGRFKSLFSWDCEGMKNGVHVEGDPKPGTKDKYWTVEVAIPFDTFWVKANLPPKDGDMWRFNAYRFERKSPEDKQNFWQAAFSPPGSGNFHTPWRFGKIYFKENK
jgi:hypothetical protein